MTALNLESVNDPIEVVTLHAGFCPIAKGDSAQIKIRGGRITDLLLERLKSALEDCLRVEGYEVVP